MQLPGINDASGRRRLHHHQPPGGRRDAGSHASPSAPTNAANRHQRRLASLPFSSLEMTDWSSPHSFPRWRWVKPARQRPLRTDSPSATKPAIDSDGKPSIEPRANFGYALGVYMCQSYTNGLRPRSTTASLALAAVTTPARDAGKLHQICREVASPERDGFRRAARRLRPAARPRKRPRQSRASVGLMEHRT